MAGLRISALSTEYVKWKIDPPLVGKPVDPSLGADPEFAFVNLATDEDRAPATGDWKAGSWERFAGQIIAKALIGPDGVVTLTPGDYGIWVKYEADGEIPVIRVGSLTIE